MAGKSFLVRGAELEYLDDDNTTWVHIDEMKSFTFNPGSGEEVDATNWDSEGWKETHAGPRDPGTADATMNLNPAEYASQRQLIEDSLNGTRRNYRLTLGNEKKTRYEFLAEISAPMLPSLGEVNSVVEQSVSFRLSGPVTITFNTVAP